MTIAPEGDDVTDHLTLPDGRAISLDETTAGTLLAGIVSLEDVTVGEQPAVWEETETVAAGLAEKYAGKQPSEIAGLREARELYRSFGMDFTRHRPSSEALLRRVLNQKGLYRLNNAVDCCNLASLAFLLPIGMYDQDQIDRDITLRTGRDGEEYPGIRKAPVHLTGRLALFDAQGGFGSPTSDSARTCVGENTTRVLAIIMATASYERRSMERHVEHFASLFERHCGAEIGFSGLMGG